MVSCPYDGDLGQRTGLRGNAEAVLEHGGCEGLTIHRGRYQEVTGPPELGLRGCWRPKTDLGTKSMRVGVAALDGVKRRSAKDQPQGTYIFISESKDLGSKLHNLDWH